MASSNDVVCCRCRCRTEQAGERAYVIGLEASLDDPPSLVSTVGFGYTARALYLGIG